MNSWLIFCTLVIFGFAVLYSYYYYYKHNKSIANKLWGSIKFDQAGRAITDGVENIGILTCLKE